MRRLIVVFGLALTLSLQTLEADAGWPSAKENLHSMKANWNAFWNRVHLDWHRNNAWPEPFNLVDQKAVHAPFAVMIDKGWQLQNTIQEQLFESETQQLTKAGKLKVRWILTQMPVHRRSVFVLKGRTTEITEMRLAAVQQAAVEAAGEGGAAMVALTDIVPRGGSGAYFERIHKGYETAAPPPALPVVDDMDSGS